MEFFSRLTFGLAVVLGAGIAALYYLMLFDDGKVLEKEINDLQVQMAVKAKEKTKLQKDIQESLKIKERVNTLSDQFREALQYLPSEWHSDELISDISKQAQISGATIVKMSPQKEIITKDIYEEMRVDFELKGSFVSLMLFVANISKIKRLIEVSELYFKNEKIDAESPILNLSGRLIAFRYLSKEDQGAQNAQEK